MAYSAVVYTSWSVGAQPAAPVWDSTIPDVEVTEGNSGSVNINRASDTTGSISYSINPPVSGFSIVGEEVVGTEFVPPGTYSITIDAENIGGIASDTFDYVVTAVLAPTQTANQYPGITTYVDQNIGIIDFATGYWDNNGSPITSYSFSPGAPTGVSLNSATGAATGTPSVIGDTVYVVRATNAGGITSSNTFTWSVIAIPSVPVPSDEIERAITPAPRQAVRSAAKPAFK